MESDKEIFKGKKLADLFEEIYNKTCNSNTED